MKGSEPTALSGRFWASFGRRMASMGDWLGMVRRRMGEASVAFPLHGMKL